MKKALPLVLLIVLSFHLNTATAQVPDSCKLSIGTNMSGMFDWSTELPFVDMMHHAREWYTKSIDDPNFPWNSEQAGELTYREDGYPTHIPQSITTSSYDQQVATIWAITDAWPVGTYTVLYDGTGALSFTGSIINFQQAGEHRYTFEMIQPKDGAIEMIITASAPEDPLHNIRVLMPGTEETYEEHPFYDKWVQKISDFQAIRFMDWGQTNNWGNDNPGITEPYEFFSWEDRSHMDHYTWAYNKGVPYEMMITLMNYLDKDGWVCVPHRAGEAYQKNMAELFKNTLEDDRHLYVEYSNEVWNWIFDQTHWLNRWGCEEQGISWPEGIVPFVQNTMDYWTDVYSDDLDRITRVAGVFVAWQDVSERIIYNLDPESFDAISPTYYVGLNEDQDAVLDELGEEATAEDIMNYAFANIPEVLSWLDGMQSIADSLDKRMVFYEGGQHLTPHPFGVEPTYAQALLDAQRSPLMYDFYDTWLDSLRKYQRGDKPVLLMNFGFVSGLSAQYGSWGVLEEINQDTTAVPAPKYSAILDNMAQCGVISSTENEAEDTAYLISIFPNPVTTQASIAGSDEVAYANMYDIHGRLAGRYEVVHNTIELSKSLTTGIYILQLYDDHHQWLANRKVVIKK